jgi:hypothetical protein
MTTTITIDEVRHAVAEIFTKMLAATQSPWFDTEGAAKYLGCTPGTMKVWRSRGEGPRYHVIQDKLVRYHVDQLDAFVRGEGGK